jgi:lysophospholipase L1-like esterase
MLKILSINILLIILLLFSSEFLIRNLDLVPLQGYDKKIFIEENNIVLNRPNSLLIAAGKKVKTDKNGFRVPLKETKYDGNFKNTLILGDSTSFGFGVDEKDTFVGILRDNVKSNLHNGSVIGHNLDSYIYLLKKYFDNSNNNFDNVIIFLCLNDIITKEGVVVDKKLKKTIKLENENFFMKFLKRDVIFKTNVYLRERSALFVFLKSIVLNSVERYYIYMSNPYKNKNELIKYAASIDRIKVFTSKKNIDIKFVLLPFKMQTINSCDEKYLQPQIKIRRIFKESNLNLYDFSENFCTNKDNEKFFLNFDPVHLSKAGHKFVSTLLLEKHILN